MLSVLCSERNKQLNSFKDIQMTSVMSPDSSYGRYDALAPVDHSLMSPAHKEREPELHIGSLRL